MNDITLPAEDVVELVEMLEFLHDWTTSDRHRLDESLTRFTRTSTYNIDHVRARPRPLRVPPRRRRPPLH